MLDAPALSEWITYPFNFPLIKLEFVELKTFVDFESKHFLHHFFVQDQHDTL